MKKCFLICKSMYVLKVYSIQYTLWQNTNVEIISFGQNKQFKKCPLFSFASSNSSLICDSYISWSTRFVSLKLCVVFSIFDSVSLLLKFTFLFNKMHGPDGTVWLWNVIIPFRIKIIEKPHTVLLPDLWSLSCSKKF